MDLIHAVESHELAVCLDSINSLEKQYLSYYGAFHLELYKLRCQSLTTFLLIGIYYSTDRCFFSELDCRATLGDEENARKTCAKIVTYLCLSLANMPYHPLLGVQLFTLGEFVMLMVVDDVSVNMMTCHRRSVSSESSRGCSAILSLVQRGEIVMDLLVNSSGYAF